MAGLKRIKFHYEGFDQLRKSAEVKDALTAKGEAIASAAGGSPDFEVIVTEGASRARVIVTTATFEGMRAEATDRALTNALSAGRG
jgi:hypothetical protein